jgi:hypothetical protein
LENYRETHPSKYFDNVVLVFIVLSSIILAIDNPIHDKNENFHIIIGYCDLIFTAVFFVEAMIKIIAKGFYSNRLGPV